MDSLLKDCREIYREVDCAEDGKRLTVAKELRRCVKRGCGGWRAICKTWRLILPHFDAPVVKMCEVGYETARNYGGG